MCAILTMIAMVACLIAGIVSHFTTDRDYPF